MRLESPLTEKDTGTRGRLDETGLEAYREFVPAIISQPCARLGAEHERSVPHCVHFYCDVSSNRTLDELHEAVPGFYELQGTRPHVLASMFLLEFL